MTSRTPAETLELRSIPDRVRKRIAELDEAVIWGMGRNMYPMSLADDRDLLEAIEKALTASRVNHPIPGQGS